MANIIHSKIKATATIFFTVLAIFSRACSTATANTNAIDSTSQAIGAISAKINLDVIQLPTIATATVKPTEAQTTVAQTTVQVTEEASESIAENTTPATGNTEAEVSNISPIEDTQPTTQTTYTTQPTEKQTVGTSSGVVPEFKFTDTIAYISCTSAGLYSVPIIYGDEQWIIDSYDICMAHKYATPEYFGEGHSVVLAGHNTKSLSQLNKAAVGDLITVHTVYGSDYTYKITYSKLVKNVNNSTLADLDTGEPVLELKTPNSVLQLYTCVDHIGYNLNYRWFVKAELVSTQS